MPGISRAGFLGTQANRLCMWSPALRDGIPVGTPKLMFLHVLGAFIQEKSHIDRSKLYLAVQSH